MTYVIALARLLIWALAAPGLPLAARSGDRPSVRRHPTPPALQPPMPSIDAVELAALAASFGPVLIDSRRPLPREALHRYWAASRCRANHWCREMKRHAQRDGGSTRGLWAATRPIIEDILLSEVLTRVWGAVLTASDQRRGEREAEPIARSALAAHLDARTRALNLLLSTAGVPASGAVRINRLRNQAERWTDLLVGFLAGKHRVGAYACQLQRMRQFAADFADDPRWKPGQPAWRLLSISLRKGFSPARARRRVTSGEFSSAVSASILECFDGQVLDVNLHFPGFWLQRVQSLADTTQNMLRELAELEATPALTAVRAAC